jgi:hypothetical protein
MKKALIFLFAVVATGAFAQNKKYISSMEKNLGMLDTVKSINGWQQAANGFERIANVEKKEWLPNYYIAFCNLMMAAQESKGDMVDAYCDKADALLNKADSISPDNSEIYTLKALSNSIRIKVNPMARGAKYGMESGMNTAKAKELDPFNPRPYFLEGQGKFYTPPAFGGGKDKALPLFEEAVKKFAAFKPASSIHPKWGEEQAKKMLEECKK